MFQNSWIRVGICAIALCVLIGVTFFVTMAQDTSDEGVELLPNPIVVEALPTGAELRFELSDQQLLVGKHFIRLSFDLHGACLLTVTEDEGRDASAFFFQSPSEWKYVNLIYLSDLGFQNCHSGEQTIDIPLSRFMDKTLTRQLDPAVGVSAYGFRIWDFEDDTKVTFNKVTLMTLPTC